MRSNDHLPPPRTPPEPFLRSSVRAPVLPGDGVTAGLPNRLSGPNIHDDATAQRLGFRGGTIAGSIHMDQFVAVLIKAFGPSWMETGSLSLVFKNATVSGERVVAMVDKPAMSHDLQVGARTERVDGMVVATGTASVGCPVTPSYLHSIDLRATDPSGLRILHNVEPGTKLEYPGKIDSSLASWIANDSFEFAPDPAGTPAEPSAIVQLLRNPGRFSPNVKEAVGLFGAIEIRHHNGPIYLDTDYQVVGKVVALGESPQTEYIWYDTQALDESGRVVASMRMQQRWMKASSPLYADQRPETF
jgi:hypothetical protein